MSKEIFAVHIDQCTFHPEEGFLSTEAGGDLGLPAGEFPLRVEIVYESGKRTVLRRWGPIFVGEEHGDKELAGFKYVTEPEGEHILTLWND